MADLRSPYDIAFYEYQREGALRSARRLLPVLYDKLHIASVLDVGCGAGAWLRGHIECGAEEILGIDGDYVDRNLLLIPTGQFQPVDISSPFDLGRSFNLVTCLEVAEHIPEAASDILLDNLVRHSRLVLFSAAVPGQGGKDHINERPLSYWRGLFAKRGYRAYDFIREKISKYDDIEWWYRYNTILYVHESVASLLPDSVAKSEVPISQSIVDYSPTMLRIRKFFLRLLPVSVISAIAWLKHRVLLCSPSYRRK